MLKPRDYQVSAIDRAWDALMQSKNTSGLIVAPTGTGKTVTFAHLAERFKPWGRIMMIAHREELIFQAANKFGIVSGERPDIEMASLRANENFFKSPIVVSSVPTLCAKFRGGHRMDRFDPREFSLLIIDEAHHATAATYRRVIRHFRQNPMLKVVGVTATPDRSDGLALGKHKGGVFDTVISNYEMMDAITDGWLVPIRQHRVKLKSLDYSGIRTVAGDLNRKQLQAVCEIEENIHGIVSPTIDLAGDRKALVFTPSVAAARRMAEIFNRHRPGSAHAISGETPTEQRRDLVKAYSEGAFQYLVNCMVFTEGFDDPSVEVVVLGRASKSRAVVCQQIGRGTRPLPSAGIDNPSLSAPMRRVAIQQSAKPYLTVLDFVGNSGQHRLITPADILGGKCNDERVADKVNRYTADGEMDLNEAVEQAVVDVAREEEEEREAKDATARYRDEVRAILGAQYKTTLVDPFGRLDLAEAAKNPPSKDVLISLAWFGVDPTLIATMTKPEAIALRDRLMGRKKTGMCSWKQERLLKRYGYNTDNISMKEASRIIDGLAKAGWKRR